MYFLYCAAKQRVHPSNNHFPSQTLLLAQEHSFTPIPVLNSYIEKLLTRVHSNATKLVSCNNNKNYADLKPSKLVLEIYMAPPHSFSFFPQCSPFIIPSAVLHIRRQIGQTFIQRYATTSSPACSLLQQKYRFRLLRLPFPDSLLMFQYSSILFCYTIVVLHPIQRLLFSYFFIIFFGWLCHVVVAVMEAIGVADATS